MGHLSTVQESAGNPREICLAKARSNFCRKGVCCDPPGGPHGSISPRPGNGGYRAMALGGAPPRTARTGCLARLGWSRGSGGPVWRVRTGLADPTFLKLAPVFLKLVPVFLKSVPVFLKSCFVFIKFCFPGPCFL